MIKIIQKKKRKTDPYYILKYKYMIGDANGKTDEEVELSVDNPHIERYVSLLNSIQPMKGHWGVILDSTNLKGWLKEKQITPDDYEFLLATMLEGESESKVYDVEEDEYLLEFFEGVRADTEYSFLTLQEIKLFYVDETGKKLETEIVPG